VPPLATNAYPDDHRATASGFCSCFANFRFRYPETRSTRAETGSIADADLRIAVALRVADAGWKMPAHFMLSTVRITPNLDRRGNPKCA
jgi:hypothetical protein